MTNYERLLRQAISELGKEIETTERLLSASLISVEALTKEIDDLKKRQIDNKAAKEALEAAVESCDKDAAA